MAAVPTETVKHVVVMVQENHTTDNYFTGLAPWGGNVATGWPTTPNPPAGDQPHDRHAYFRWLTGAGAGTHEQIDTPTVLPYYLHLAITGAFLENHCSGFGTNSTPNHLLIVGGQTPTLRNPPRGQQPVWDMPSLPGHAEAHGLTWAAYTGRGGYPVQFYRELIGSQNIKHSAQIVTDAAAGNLPALSFLWHDSPLDEHPAADVRLGMNAIWQAVDAVQRAGAWADTVFLLTWDDWGGWDDHVRTPVVEYTPDNVQLAYGPRVPLIIFGGHVRPGIDTRWCSHVSIGKTVLQLLGLPPLGVPRLDDDPGLADLIDTSITIREPPLFGTPVPPADPTGAHPQPLPPPPGAPAPVGPILLRNGKQLPPPNDVPLPRQSHPPTN